ncbi:IS30 family transposase [Nonomuraea typhae]|uniref:IS30 family transposase n=1 Tax=Nonomuraea typhae TaxID=2603600 RepID=A0ABW7YL57_9ACTN
MAAERLRRAVHLSAEERESISRGLEAGASLRSIVATIGRPASTVSREVGRNGGRVKYRAVVAEQRAHEQAPRPKPSALQDNPVLRQLVIELLDNEWSPEHIVGHLRLTHPGNPLMRISPENIYHAIYTTRWKVIPRELCTKLRTRRPIRKNKKNTVKGQWRSQITGARPIEERPDAANAQTELGHLEGDLTVGAKNSQVATLVDRKSRYLTMVALPSRHTTTVIPALRQAFSRMNARLVSTLTWDRGRELAGHRLLTEATGVDIFFAAPRSPWQRGPNENTNKLIRQYLPKGLDLSLYSQANLDALAARLNNRPR